MLSRVLTPQRPFLHPDCRPAGGGGCSGRSAALPVVRLSLLGHRLVVEGALRCWGCERSRVTAALVRSWYCLPSCAHSPSPHTSKPTHPPIKPLTLHMPGCPWASWPAHLPLSPASIHCFNPLADLAPLSLGKLTSLAEIEWVRAEQQRCPALRYYYLGFYIHDCHRMRYKVGSWRSGVCLVYALCL